MGQESSKSSKWAMPTCKNYPELNITSWETNPVPDIAGYRPPNFECYKDGANPPGLLKEFLVPLTEERSDELNRKYKDEDLQAHERAMPVYDEYLTAKDNATSLLHPTNPEDLEPWSWACRIYARTVHKEANGLRKGNKVPTAWGVATAYLVRDAHAEGSNSQWLLTSAHNVVHIFQWAFDKEGTITDTNSHPCVTVADAIMVAVGWGDQTHIGWVDKIAVMSDFFSINMGNKDRYRFDGAALRIKDSLIPAKYWKSGPVLGTIIPPNVQSYPNVVGNGKLFCPGYPGSQNFFKDLAGLYIGGKNTQKTFRYNSFEPIQLSLLANDGKFQHKAPRPDEKENDTSAQYDGCLIWTLTDCFSSEGQSGSACVLFAGGEAVIVGSLNGPGTGIPFAVRESGARPVAVDAIGLLKVVGVSEQNLALLLKNMSERFINIS